MCKPCYCYCMRPISISAGQRQAVGASSKTNFLVFIWFHLGWPSLWVSFRARNSLCPHLLSCGQNCLLLRCFCCFCAASALLLCAYDFLKAAPPPPPAGFPLRSLMPCACARPSLAPAAGCRPHMVARDMAGCCLAIQFHCVARAGCGSALG